MVDKLKFHFAEMCVKQYCNIVFIVFICRRLCQSFNLSDPPPEPSEMIKAVSDPPPPRTVLKFLNFFMYPGFINHRLGLSNT